MNPEGARQVDRIEERPSGFPWPPVLLVGLGAVAVAMGRWWPLAWPGLDDLPARIIGYGILAGGVVLMGWSVVAFRRARANILPHKAATTLITTGPFAIWRNPIYMADALLLAGLGQLTLNIWFVAAAGVFVAAVLMLAIVPEERHLEAKFGQAYLDYKARTRRWF